MNIHRTRRVHGSKEIPKTAHTIMQKGKKIFLDTKMGKKNKQKMSFKSHQISQKHPDNESSLILKISELAKHKFF